MERAEWGAGRGMSTQRHIAFRGQKETPGSKGVIACVRGHGKNTEFFLIQSQFSCGLAVETG